MQDNYDSFATINDESCTLSTCNLVWARSILRNEARHFLANEDDESPRNLGYERALFFSINGFFSHLNLSRGEAELFVEEVANSLNTSVCLSARIKNSQISSKQRGFYRIV